MGSPYCTEFPKGQDSGQRSTVPINPMLHPHSRDLSVSLSWQHLFREVTSALGCCSVYQEEEQQLSDSTLRVTADHGQSQTIQYHQLLNEEKGQGKGLVTQRLCKYLLQQLSTFAKTESKYEWSEFKGRRLFRDSSQNNLNSCHSTTVKEEKN